MLFYIHKTRHRIIIFNQKVRHFSGWVHGIKHKSPEGEDLSGLLCFVEVAHMETINVHTLINF